jgi:NADPH-dependent ferric siderophore reductase
MTTPRRRPAPVFHQVQVAETDQLTPGMRRITFTGEQLASYPNDGPATHFKLLLPAPGQDHIELPVAGPDGMRWPDPRPVIRTYTPRFVDRAARRLTVDFALHPDGGPATTWAQTARPGAEAVVTGARGSYRIDPLADWTLLVADETALPAVGTILRDAPAGAQVSLVAEVAGEADELKFGTAADLAVTWRHHNGEGPGMAAAQAVRDLGLPAGRGAVWVGLEAGAMRAVRRHLIGVRGLDREQLYTRGYWKLGVSDHPDHDTGED